MKYSKKAPYSAGCDTGQSENRERMVLPVIYDLSDVYRFGYLTGLEVN